MCYSIHIVAVYCLYHVTKMIVHKCIEYKGRRLLVAGIPIVVDNSLCSYSQFQHIIAPYRVDVI